MNGLKFYRKLILIRLLSNNSRAIWSYNFRNIKQAIFEVISFNPKINKYLVHFSTGDDEPLPWEYSVSELIKILLEDDTNLIA